MSATVPRLDLRRHRPVSMPSTLAVLHARTAVGHVVDLLVDEPVAAGSVRNAAPRADTIVAGAGFERVGGDTGDTVRVRRLRTLPDHVATGMRILCCGLNPSEYAADAGVGYARPGNRFWPAAMRAGIVTRDRDWASALFDCRVGFTDLVKRATPGADSLTATEFETGATRVAEVVAWLRPSVVCFVGLAGYRAAVDRNGRPGRQASDFAGAAAYVMPSTSGRNAHASLDDLTQHLRAAAALVQP